MFSIRPFRNGDPPALAEIWRSQPPQRGLLQPITSDILEICVYGKAFFDPAGLLVAEEDGAAIGFVHAGFGPDEDGNALDTSLGATLLLMTRGDRHDAALEDALLAASEAYLRSRGATVLYGGGMHPIDGFYRGVLGGSETPGVLDSTPRLADIFLRNNYQVCSEVRVLQRDLAGFRAPVTREQRQWRRDTELRMTTAVPGDWWEAQRWAHDELSEYHVVHRTSQQVLASVGFWDIEPLATSWGIRTAGMLNLYVDPSQRRLQIATYLLSESFRELQRRGVVMVEAQVMAENAAALALYSKLGFTTIDTGRLFRREGNL